MNGKIYAGVWILLAILLLLSGCERESPTPEAMATKPSESSLTALNQPTATQVPTESSTPLPTETPIPEVPEGVIVDVIHLVDAHTQANGSWEEALVEMPLYAGGEVWAKEASTALIGLGSTPNMEEPNVVRVAPNTIFTLEHPDENTVQLNLQEGQVWINIEGLSPGENFQVQTSTAVASVEGTRFSVRVDEDGRTIVSTQVNTVTVSTTEGIVQVGPHYQTIVGAGEAPTAPHTISDIDFIRWSLAAGPYLSVIAPLGDLVDTFTTEAFVLEGLWSGDGSTFSFQYYLPGPVSSQNYWAHINVAQSTQITDSLILSNTNHISYNPVGNAAAWTRSGSDDMQICTSQPEDIEPTCFGSPDFRYYVGDATWSPDGGWLLYKLNDTSTNGADNLFISRPDGSENRQLTFSESRYTNRYAWSPDGTQVAFATTSSLDWDTPGQAWVINADGSNPHMIMENLMRPLSPDPLSWSPDGQWLALESADGFYLVSPDGEEREQIQPSNGGSFYNVKWSPTPNGWPLFFGYVNTSTPEIQSGTFFVTSETVEPQKYFSNAWGPVYSPDRSLAAFGTNQYFNEEPQVYLSTIYFFQVLPWWSELNYEQAPN